MLFTEDFGRIAVSSIAVSAIAEFRPEFAVGASEGFARPTGHGCGSGLPVPSVVCYPLSSLVHTRTSSLKTSHTKKVVLYHVVLPDHSVVWGLGSKYF